MELAEPVALAPFPSSVPARPEGTGGAAWMGMAASLLLHLLVGAAVIGAIPISPEASPPVIDLTLTGPAGEGGADTIGAEAAPVSRRRVPDAVLRPDGPPVPSERPGTAPLPESPLLSAPTTLAKEAAVTAPAGLSDTAAQGSAPSAGTARAFPAAPFPPGTQAAGAAVPPNPGVVDALAATGERGGKGTLGNPSGITGAKIPVSDFAWIRDTIQRGIAYPALAQKMGWEGKVVVAFRLLPDGSVRDVRVVQGSGHAALDRGAIDAVRNASPFARSPVTAEIITPVVYRMSPAP